MKLWDKGYDTNKLIETFTIGKDKELDILLAPYDIIGTIAHIIMLKSIGLLKKDELKILHTELVNIYNDTLSGKFIIEDGVEDVHSQVELMLTRKLGDIGKKVHSGRSRNDQVLLDLKLFMRNEIIELVQLTRQLANQLITVSEKYKDVLMPGYTHLQVAMPSSFGLWFGAYVESLSDDLVLTEAAFRIANQNPLGSAAGYGSSFPLNRQMTTDLLAFESMNYNVVYAQMGRGKVEKTVAFALSSIAATLAKFAMDTCLYNSQNFAFIKLPDEFTTGSSIMPHKKNPDVFELIRAKCNKIQALPNEIALIINNLPSGYHRDLQIIKENFMPAFENLKQCLSITNLMLENIEVNSNILEDDKYNYIFSVEEVNKNVLQGIPFRDAYKIVAAEIEKANYKPNQKILHTHEGSIGNLCNDKIKMKLDKTINNFKIENIEKASNNLLLNI